MAGPDSGHDEPQSGTSRADDGSRHDAALSSLIEMPFRLVRPPKQTVPFIFASPHSGRIYPENFVQQSRLGPIALRQSEDAFVEDLFAAATELGATCMAAQFPRAYCDVNRAPGELDRAMFDGMLSVTVDTPTAHVSAGLGVVPRIVRDGAEIYRERLPPDEAAKRLSRFYKPYHAQLLRLIEETRMRFGVAVIIDCHSMPSAAAVPDIVLGDRYGMAATPALTRRAERAFERRAFTVGRNVPYAGGYTTHLYGQPARGVHALQVEVNRALYLDEERIVRSARFEDVKRRISEVLLELTALEPALLQSHGGHRDQPGALAAE